MCLYKQPTPPAPKTILTGLSQNERSAAGSQRSCTPGSPAAGCSGHPPRPHRHPVLRPLRLLRAAPRQGFPGRAHPLAARPPPRDPPLSNAGWAPGPRAGGRERCGCCRGAGENRKERWRHCSRLRAGRLCGAGAGAGAPASGALLPCPLLSGAAAAALRDGGVGGGAGRGSDGADIAAARLGVLSQAEGRVGQGALRVAAAALEPATARGHRGWQWVNITVIQRSVGMPGKCYHKRGLSQHVPAT